ncbi:MAG: FkbM family methyltransferase [Wenzhouxiangellaceae bacterium]|nr:FkbM family methyltransferase [Wenzhouxiangellaceae bacterium]
MKTSANLRAACADRGARWRAFSGLLRSLWMYRRPGRQRSLRNFYRQWIQPGDLVFDIGAHVGDRSLAFASLGARVVAAEPQPQLAAFLRRGVGRRRRIRVLETAVGATEGPASMWISRATPTVSSLAEEWKSGIGRANPTFAGVNWDQRLTVAVTTLDRLIADYGEPVFCKIDVEGFEHEVLAGLGHALKALSLEFVQGSLDTARACIDELQRLGCYQFNAVAGEGRAFLWSDWRDAEAVRTWLADGADGVSSGDLYARLIRRSIDD